MTTVQAAGDSSPVQLCLRYQMVDVPLAQAGGSSHTSGSQAQFLVELRPGLFLELDLNTTPTVANKQQYANVLADTAGPVQAFLAALDSSPLARFTVEHYTDYPKGAPKKRQDPLRGRYPDLGAADVTALLPKLVEVNSQGAGIFISRNECTGHRRENAVTRVRGIHADLDRVSHKQFAEICELLPPSIIVRTSEEGHYQLYWQLSPGEVLSVTDAKRLNQRLVTLGADPAAVDASRLLRLPGFRHMKYRADGRTPVVLAQYADVRYTVGELDRALPEPKDSTDRKGAHTGVESTVASREGVDSEAFRGIRDRVIAMYPALWRGEWQRAPRRGGTAGYPSKSEADLALASHIAYACKAGGVDDAYLSQAVETLFGESALGADQKWVTRPGYRQGTVEKAISGLGPVLPKSAAIQLESHGDIRNAKAFASTARGRLIHVTTTGQWLRWVDDRWTVCEKDEPFAVAKEVVDMIMQSAQAVFRQDQERGRKLVLDAMAAHALARLSAMIKLAISEPGMATTSRELDSDPYLLGVENGVIDLRTGHLLFNQPEYLITRYCNAAHEEGATCPGWLKFLDEIFSGDTATIASVQRLLGCTFLGLSSEEILVICYGHGSNGKSVFNNVVHKIIGGYAVTAPPSLLIARRKGDTNPRDDVAMLAGGRYVSINETQAGDTLDEQVVKVLAGREPISARHLYGQYFEFTPGFTPWLRTNHKPIVKGEDDGIWRRLVVLHFGRKFGDHEKDPYLEEKLLAERNGILMWVAEGARLYLKDGLQLSPAMKAELGTYRRESDLLGEFLDQQTQQDHGGRVPQDSLYDAYRSWCLSNGLQPMAKKSLTQRLTERGFSVAKSGPWRYYSGLRLRPLGCLFPQDGVDGISVDLGKSSQERLMGEVSSFSATSCPSSPLPPPL